MLLPLDNDSINLHLSWQTPLNVSKRISWLDATLWDSLSSLPGVGTDRQLLDHLPTLCSWMYCRAKGVYRGGRKHSTADSLLAQLAPHKADDAWRRMGMTSSAAWVSDYLLDLPKNILENDVKTSSASHSHSCLYESLALKDTQEPKTCLTRDKEQCFRCCVAGLREFSDHGVSDVAPGFPCSARYSYLHIFKVRDKNPCTQQPFLSAVNGWRTSKSFPILCPTFSVRHFLVLCVHVHFCCQVPHVLQNLSPLTFAISVLKIS